MKMKKLLVTVATVALLTMGGTSAFALSGWGDTQATAEYFPLGYGLGSTIENPFDSEWTYYYNDTGKTIGIRATLGSPSTLNYDFFYLTYDASGEQTSLILARDTGVGGTDTAEIVLRPGEKVYFNVIGHDATQYSPSAIYGFDLKLIAEQ
ncbi:hypothetical protein BVG16_23260 [Paenibacillus selenitireducens]|uniref:Uncharacterized protein n=1 Tax=Paenibacillus selenitireducens TaxID=1324314 RepID=A0A1T2X4A4_9BACL|nr:hypothetical protein [Paenibacillus selenitireducens]OPA74680.1 hypothetical protein BVG16_23260 [Paenibacillus selenitireducens]